MNDQQLEAARKQYRIERQHFEDWFDDPDLPYTGNYMPIFEGLTLNSLPTQIQAQLAGLRPLIPDLLMNIFLIEVGAVEHPYYTKDALVQQINPETDEEVFDGEDPVMITVKQQHGDRLTYQKDLINFLIGGGN